MLVRLYCSSHNALGLVSKMFFSKAGIIYKGRYTEKVQKCVSICYQEQISANVLGDPLCHADTKLPCLYSVTSSSVMSS